VSQYPSFFDEKRRDLEGQFAQEPRHDVTPGILAQVEVESVDRLLSRLLGGKAGPLMAGVL
jgi:hypothetical protein